MAYASTSPARRSRMAAAVNRVQAGAVAFLRFDYLAEKQRVLLLRPRNFRDGIGNFAEKARQSMPLSAVFLHILTHRLLLGAYLAKQDKR